MPDAAIYGTAGGLAGQIAWACSIVPDSVKSRIQTSASLTELPGSIETFRHIVKKKGYRGLFAGVEVALIRAWPANAALFVGYEYTKKLCDKLIIRGFRLILALFAYLKQDITLSSPTLLHEHLDEGL